MCSISTMWYKRIPTKSITTYLPQHLILVIPMIRYPFDKTEVFLFARQFRRYPILLSHRPILVRRNFSTSSLWCHVVCTFVGFVLRWKTEVYVGTVQKTICLFSTFTFPSMRIFVIFNCIYCILNGRDINGKDIFLFHFYDGQPSRPNAGNVFSRLLCCFG